MKYLSLFVLAVFGVGCGPDVLFEQSMPVAETGWAYADSLDFSFEIADTTKVYDVILEVEHSEDYGFQNLYVKTNTVFPSGKTDKQVLSLELANKVGFWLGKCSGGNCHLRIPIQQKIFFPEKGTYHFHMEQFMRQSPLPELKSITFKIEETGELR